MKNKKKKKDINQKKINKAIIKKTQEIDITHEYNKNQINKIEFKNPLICKKLTYPSKKYKKDWMNKNISKEF